MPSVDLPHLLPDISLSTSIQNVPYVSEDHSESDSDPKVTRSREDLRTWKDLVITRQQRRMTAWHAREEPMPDALKYPSPVLMLHGDLEWWHYCFLQRPVPQRKSFPETARRIEFRPTFAPQVSKGVSMAEVLFYGRGVQEPDEILFSDDNLPEGCALPTIFLQMVWPGYGDWIGSYKPTRKHLTRMQFARAISRLFANFIKEKEERAICSEDARWRVGPDAYHIDTMRLISVYDVDGHWWQAEVAVVDDNAWSSA
ncbi:hypothetical protein PLICRDRAFT_57798 [Plicaturopsis crispa FD-325 SS-3]|uniref:Uncharacterized protein n=1 Tax=Plicaturopsis crispa FD-325 SS-3 TaxID=944288 RepID=A0A0C9SR60_PLICR|nr:hypothetical protein PLICRDRAFT_57798 [Plicaturopsis crispa FD-325 SS-3]